MNSINYQTCAQNSHFYMLKLNIKLLMDPPPQKKNDRGKNDRRPCPEATVDLCTAGPHQGWWVKPLDTFTQFYPGQLGKTWVKLGKR